MTSKVPLHRAGWLLAAMCLASWVWADTITITSPKPTPTPTVKGSAAAGIKTTPTPTPTATPTPKASKAKKGDKDKEPQLPGVVIPRARGGFLAVEVAGGDFKVTFYDAKKNLTEVDAARAGVRWRAVGIINERHGVLLPSGDNKALVGNSFVKPPFTFKLYLTLLAENNTALENYVVDMNELPGTPTPERGNAAKKTEGLKE